jgi:hypothetical protein
MTLHGRSSRHGQQRYPGRHRHPDGKLPHPSPLGPAYLMEPHRHRLQQGHRYHSGGRWLPVLATHGIVDSSHRLLTNRSRVDTLTASLARPGQPSRKGKKTMTKTWYVIGHRNPDTDSIASAIGYAALKARLGMPGVVAAWPGLPTLKPATSSTVSRFPTHSFWRMFIPRCVTPSIASR